MNLIRAVGKGAVQKPRIVFLHYKGNPAASKSLALVGKGICFDSGGLNLKPTGSIEQMHMDKGGACAVFGAMHAVAARGLKANVVGVLVLAENAISAEACKPHEILKSYKVSPPPPLPLIQPLWIPDPRDALEGGRVSPPPPPGRPAYAQPLSP